ncbi:neuroblast differentiation-associated protein AHNAK-like [Syngnathus typhle]|uniref:neuroblast differentiation-associated protein AHNAK-like n=1 Tax=Syngnathus typhle TaxID=161592 RepID=UPI002A6B308E|nr:neuroblast differentiation-associated protein AHNAK-like [Syngnathus typhle]
MSKLKEAYSPESGMIVKTAQDGGAEGLIYGGGGKDGIFIKEVVPESPASKSLQLKEGDQLLSATVYFDNVSYQDAIQILEHAQAYKVKLCLKRKPDITETEPLAESDIIPEDETFTPEMREHGKSKRRGDARISWPKFPSLGRGKKSRFARSHSSSEADEQRKLELSPTTSDTESPIKTQDALKGKKRHKMKLPSLTKRGRVSSSEDQDTDPPTCTQEAAELLSPEGLQSPVGTRPEVHRKEEITLVEDSDSKVTKPLALQHKVELIAIDSALKTTDLTVALTGQESPTGPLSPDGKKKKKERSELKMKIMGKDKSNKKEAKAKSPKRLKTLGASLEIADLGIVRGDQREQKTEIEQTSPCKGKSKKRTLLPKREDIEIPGMEDMSRRTQVKGAHDELPETVQLSIDVDSVKEAVSKLPGYKLPKVDMCGVPIPDEITVIDANAQRISVKTPTKFADGKTKQEAPISKAEEEDASTPELSKTSFKVPKIKPSDLSSEDVLIVTRMDPSNTETTQECQPPLDSKESDKKSKTAKIVLPSIGFSKAGFRIPEVGMYLPKPNISGPKDNDVKGERTIFLQEEIREEGITSASVISTGELEYIDSAESPVERELDGKRSPLQNLKFEVSLPKLRAPQIDLSLSKTDGKVKSPDAQLGAYKYIPEEKMAVDIAGLPGDQEAKGRKFKMPQFDFTIPEITGPQLNVNIFKKEEGVKKPDPEPEVQIKEALDVDLSPVKAQASPQKDKTPEHLLSGVELDGHKAKFQMPHFKVKGPDVDFGLSEEGGDATVPKAKVDTNVDIPRKDLGFNVSAPSVEIEGPLIDVKTTDADQDGKGGKFNMPHLSFPMPKIKGHETEKGTRVTTPEAKVDVQKPDTPKIYTSEAEVKLFVPPACEVKMDGQRMKLKMPKFGVKMPKLKGPEIEFDLKKKDIDVNRLVTDETIPQTPKLNVNIGQTDGLQTEVDIKKPDLQMQAFKSNFEQSDKNLKENVDIKCPDVPTLDLGKVNIGTAEVKMEEHEIDTEPLYAEIEFKGGKFKMPKFGISMPKMKAPDIDISFSKKDGEIQLPEAEVELPDVDVKLPSAKVEIEGPEVDFQPSSVEGSSSKFKLPRFKLPKLGVALPQVSVEVPDTEKEIKVEGTDVKSPELKVGAKIPDVAPDVDVKIDGQESKFKMPKFGIAMPKMKGPDCDISLSKKDGHMKFPEAELELPDVDVKLPSAKVEIEGPEVDFQQGSVEGSPSKFKLPTFKLPKLGVPLPQVSVEVPDIDKETKVEGADVKSPELKVGAQIPDVATDVDVKMKRSKFSFPKFSLTKQSSKESEVEIDHPDVDVSIPAGKLEITSPEVEFQSPDVDVKIDGQESKFKMPKFGIAMPKMKGPDFNISLSKKDGDIKFPEAEVELPDVDVKLPSAKVEIECPEVDFQPGSVEGSPSKFKLPTIKLPKLGVALPQVSVEVPDVDKEIKVEGPDVKSPELKVGAKIPDVATDVDVKMKRSKFSFPKFSLTKQSSKESEVEIDHPDVDVSIPAGKLDITSPEVEFQSPDVDMKIDGQESKFKMPKFGIAMPKMKGPDFDISLSKKDGDIKFPEAEVELPDVDVKLPSAKVEIECPEVDFQPGSVEGSPSKFKLPTIKLPKLGVALPQVSVEVPDMDKEIKVEGPVVKSPELKVGDKIPDVATDVDVKMKRSKFSFPKFSLTKQSSKESEVEQDIPDVDVSIPAGKLDITSPEVEFQSPDVDMKIDGQESKFKMPKFGIAMPKMKGPDFDISLSKKDGDIKFPEAEVELPDVDVKLPSAKVEIEGSEVDFQPGSVEASASTFKMPTFKLPKLGVALPQVSVEGPDMDKGIKIEGADVKSPELKVGDKIPNVATDVDVKMKRSKFSFPKFSLTKQSSKESEVEIDLPDVDVLIPEGKLEITSPEVEFQKPDIDVNIGGQESKFKMPKFGITMPKMKGPDFDISLSKKDGDIKLPKGEVELPDVDVKLSSAKVDIEAPKIEAQHGSLKGSPSKFKLPTISFPKFSLTKQSSKETEVDLDLPGVDVSIPEGNLEVTLPQVEFQSPEGQESKFKMPKFGISMPKMKGPDLDISFSQKDGEIKLPEAEVELPDVDVKPPSAKVEIDGPKIEAHPGSVEGSPSKFKLPTFKLPKLGVALPQVSVEVPDIDKELKVEGPHVKSPELKVEAKIPDAASEIDVKMKNSKFSLPKFSLTKQSSKESEVDIDLPDVDVSVQAGKLEITSPDVDVNVDGQEGKFKMPKFGISMPKMKGPDFDISLSKKDGEIKIPEAEVKLPDVDVKLPSVQVDIEAPKTEGCVEGSPSKFKLPTISFPKFSLTKQSSKEAEVDIDLPEVDVSIPEGKLEVTLPQVEFQSPEANLNIEGQESKFKMPKFGIAMPKMKGPDIDISLSKKDGEIKLPEAEVDVDVKLPSAKVEIEGPEVDFQPGSVEGSPSKFKLPTIKFPKFSFSKQSSKESEVEIGLPDVNVAIPEGDLEVTSPKVDFKSPDVDVNIDGQESNFKMPKMIGPDFEISVSNKDGDIKLPEAEVELPDIGSVEGSPSKFKLPTISFPKFSLTKQSSKKAEVKINLPDVDVSVPAGKLEITSPEVEFQPPDVDVNIDGQESKFKMPKFGIAMPKMKGPDFDISLPKKDGGTKFVEAEVDLPDGDVKLPSVQVDIEAPNIEAQPGSVEGSPSKSKLPTFKLPKLGVALPQVSVEVPDMDKEIKVEGADVKSPEIKVEAKIPDAATNVDVKMKRSRFSFPKFSLTKQSSKESEVEIDVPDVDVSVPAGKLEITSPDVDVKIDGQDSKFKMPKFGIAMPKMKGPDFEISVSKKDGEIKLPEAEVELPDIDFKLPSANVDIEAPKIKGSVEGSPSKFKLPTMSFPKFSLTKQSSKEAEVEIGLPDVDVSVPAGKLEITSPEVEFQPPDVDVNIDGQESKFKMPKFGIAMPKMKGLDYDISLSKKDGGIKLAEAEVELPDVDVKLPSVQVDIEAPKIEAQPGSVEGSPSKFKLPTFKLPKLGVALPQVNVEVPDMDKEIKVEGADIKSPEIKVEAKILDAATDVDVKMKRSRFSFPKFSLTKQRSKESEVEIDIPDVDVSISEGKLEITSPEVEFQTPDVDVNIDGQESKFKMPKFGITMPKMKGPTLDINLSKKDGEIKLPQAKVELPDVDVKLPSAKVEIEGPKTEAKPGSVEGSPSKFKLPTISFPKLSLTKQSSKESEVEIGLPDVDVSVPGGNLEITSPKLEFQPPDVDVNIEGQESKFRFPKFGISMPKVKGPDIDIGLAKKDGDITFPEAEVQLKEAEMKLPSGNVEIEDSKIQVQPGSVEGSPSKFKLPTFKLPKLGVALPQVSVEVSDIDQEIKVEGADVKSPELKVGAKIPDVATDVDVKMKRSKFSFPKFTLTKQSSKESEVEIDRPDVDVSVPAGKLEITSPEVVFQPPDVDVNIDGQESKLKMPNFGIAMPKIQGPDFDISLSKTGGDIKLLEAEAELPDVDVRLPSVQVDVEVPKIEAQPSSIEGSPSKFKLPTIKFPKFSLTKQSSKEAEVKIDLPDVDVSVPARKLEITSPEVKFQPPDVDVKIDGQESKFKMPKFGITMPKMKGPDFDISLSKKDGEIKLREGEVELPDVDVKLPSAKVDIEAPKIEAQPGSVEGSPSKFKLPTISFPKFSLTKQISKETEVDLDLPGVDVSIPEGNLEVTLPQEFQSPEPNVNIQVQESKFKMPKFGISMPKMKGPELDISLSQKDGEIKLPEAEVELPDVDVKLPSAKVEIEGPKIEAHPGSVEGSPSKFKLPTFKLPKLGVALPQVEVPDIDKEIKVEGPHLKSPDLKVEATIPDAASEIDVKMKKSKFSLPKFSLTKQSIKESEVDIDLPDVDVSVQAGKLEITSPDVDVNIDGQEGKFKMPKFGISMPKMKGPDFDISLSKKDGEIKIPEAEDELPDVDVKLPSVQVDIEAPKTEGCVEGSPSRFKLPAISFPKFSLTKQSSKEAEVDIDLPEVDVSIPEGNLEVTLPQVQSPEANVNIEGQESKFKMPKFGIAMPKMKGPDIDISLSKKDEEIKLPEAEMELPDVDVKLPSAKVEIKGPDVDFQPGSVEGSPSKFKLPTIKFPKFSFSKQSSKESEVKIGLPDVDVSVPEGNLEVTSPKVDFKSPDVDVNIDGQESKFKMPKFGIAMPKMKGPDFDISLSKKDGEIKLQEAQVELPAVDVKLPSGQVDIEAPKIEDQPGSVEGSPSKFKLPTFKLPKLGVALPQVNVEVPDMDKEIKVEGADIKSPEIKVDAEIPDAAPDVNVKMKRSKFSFPKFSLTKQSSKESEVEIDIPDVDVSISEGKLEITSPEVEFQTPDVDVNIDGQESKFKMPTFGIAMPKMKGPDFDISLSKKDGGIKLPESEVELPDIDVKLPSAKVDIEAPKIEGSLEGSPSKFKLPTLSFPKFSLTKQSSKEAEIENGLADVDVSVPAGKLEIPSPEVEFQRREVDVNIEGQESKIKMPKFGISMPKMKGPNIDTSLPKKDGAVILSDAEVELPHVDVKLPSVQVDIEAQPGSVEGSPSKFKLPTIKLPKLGVALPQVSVEGPDMDKRIKVEGADVKSPELKDEAKILDAATDVNVKMKRSKFSFPKFSLSKQSSKEAEVEIDLPDVDVSIPEGKLEITSPKVEFQTPDVDVNIDGQDSKFKMPKFGITMPKMKGPDFDISLSKKDGELKLAEAEVELPDVDVKLPSAKVDIEVPIIEAQPGSVEVSPSKFKLPTFSFPKFSITKDSKDSVVDIDPDVNVSVLKGKMKTSPKVEFQPPEVDVNSKITMPTFGISMPKAKSPDIDISLSKKDGAITLPVVDLKLQESEMKPPSVKVETEGTKIEAQRSSIEVSPSKFKLPSFKLPKFGGSPPKVEVPDVGKDTETDGIKSEIPEDDAKQVVSTPSIDIEGQSMEVTTPGGELGGLGIKLKLLPDVEAELPDVEVEQLESTISGPEAPKTEVDVKLSKGTGNDAPSPVSPSKFKLPSFKMPRLAFSRQKPEGESVSPDTEYKDNQPEMKAELNGDGKPLQATPTSFGAVLENLDIEFDVSKTEKEEEDPDATKEVIEWKGKEPKQQVTKSPERTGWFRFPTFGLSSPSEPAKTPCKNDQKDQKSPPGEHEEDMSPTCSVQSSDIFADISSTATSEYVSLPSSPPTKVMAKYSDLNLPADMGEMNVQTSTARSELITVESNLPEKITILSSEVLSSSEETLRVASEKIHVFTSNVQVGPESHHTKLLSAVQSAAEAGQSSSSWTVESSQSSRRTVSQKRIVRETSRESTETFVITKQITKTIDPTEFFANEEAASSIQRLRESVHSEKMRFFDGAEK